MQRSGSSFKSLASVRGRVSIRAISILPYASIEHISRFASPQGTEETHAPPLDPHLKIGIQTIHRRTNRDDAVAADDRRADRIGRAGRSLRLRFIVGRHHIAFCRVDPRPAIAAARRRWSAGGDARHQCLLLAAAAPRPGAKQVANLDHLCEDGLIFGVGVGGNPPKEFAVAGWRSTNAAGRLSAAIPLLPELWSGRQVTRRQIFSANSARSRWQPPARQPAGLRSGAAVAPDAALARAGSPCRRVDFLCRDAAPIRPGRLAKIHPRAADAASEPRPVGTGHLLFARLDRSYEAALDAASTSLSQRYRDGFPPCRRNATRPLGTPSRSPRAFRDFHAAGRRHVVIDLVGPYENGPPDRGLRPAMSCPCSPTCAAGKARTIRSLLAPNSCLRTTIKPD